MSFQIAIDGPAGVGKSTLAKLLASRLNFLYINTGLIFRGISWYILNYPGGNMSEILSRLRGDGLFIFKDNKWFLEGKELNGELLIGAEITKKTIEISKDPEVRKYALEIERAMARDGNVIMEGRDIGTTVFPNAILKIFLTASPGERALRRYLELSEKNILMGRALSDIRADIEARDREDSGRELSPLKMASDAVEINSDNRTISDLAEEIISIFNSRVG